MIMFILKSTISIFVIYILYKIFLSKENIPVFKRYFLLFGILFSVIISFVSIEPNVQIPETINRISVHSQIQEITSSDPVVQFSGNKDQSHIKWFLYGIYFLITLALLLRYIHNVKRLVCLKKDNRLYKCNGYKIVILEQDISPFSFLKTMFISQNDYNNASIKKEVLIHELAHIKQNHSIDILLIEFLQVICWFNPFIWLYKKEMRLNHEYLADRQVIAGGINPIDYQKFILNFVFRNNSSYLASSFNYSFIKKRFIMLSKEKSSAKAYIKAAITIPVIALLAIAITINQEAKALVKFDLSTEWWQPILQKHAVEEVKAYNNLGNVFEMGEQNSVTNSVVTLTNAIMIIKGNDNDYMFIRAARIEHDINSGMLNIKSGTLNTYMIDSDISKPLVSMSCEDHLSISVKDLINSNLCH